MDRSTPANRDRLAVPLLALAAATALATTGVDVVDTVNVEVDGKDTVEGTLRPAEERESYLIDLPRGATLKASAKPRGRGGPQPALDVLDPDLDVVATSPAAKSVKAPKVTAAVSGIHRVRVCGDGALDGDFQLKVRAKMPRRWSASAAEDLAPDAEDTFTFGAAAKSVARLTLSRSRKSALTPQIVEVTGPDEFSFVVPAPETASGRHVVKDVLLPSTGDYVVRFRNAGPTAGGWKLIVKLSNPKTRKRAIDLTDEVLAGEFAGEQAVFGRTIDAEGGVVAPPDSHETLGDVSIFVPASSVTAPTLIVVSESEPFFIDDDTNEGGLTYEFGPDGLTFEEPALVTIPFDTQAYDDPETEVTVALKDSETGEVELVTGTIDVLGGTITFPTSHFSRFQAASPRPRPLVGGFVELEMTGVVDDAFASGFRLGLNAVRGEAGPRTGNPVRRTLDRFEILVVPNAQTGGLLEGARDQREESGTISAGPTLDLEFGGDRLRYERGRSPDVFLRRTVEDDRATLSLLLRRVKGRPTRGALAGEWKATVVEFSAVRASDGRVSVATAGQTFDLTVSPQGQATARKAKRSVSTVGFLGGGVVPQRDSKRPLKGTLVPDGLIARLDMPVGFRTVVDTIDLHPVVRGDALVGVTGELLGPPNDPTMLVSRVVLLVRGGKDGSDADLDGRSKFAGLDLGLLPVSSQAPVAGVAFGSLGLDMAHDGKGSLRGRGTETTLRHGLTGAPSRTIRDVFVPDSKYDIAKNLTYTEDQPYERGVVFVRRGLYLSTSFEDGRIAIGFGVPARPLPE